ncbi:MAG: hypothetical protein JXX28_05810 [Deltaproteobacteria bacterium]|nr:hypothetical protein [Deltaproteobacteria bacterium]
MDLIFLSLLLGCASSAPPVAPPAPAGRAVVAVAEDVDSLLSVTSETSLAMEVMQAISYPLMELDFDCSLKKGPALAERWQWSPDGKVLSMWLRDDIRWEDGEPLDATDIAFTYELAATPAVNSPAAGHVARMTAGGRPAVLDPHHIEWRFSEAYDRDTQIGHTTDLTILPAHLLSGVDPSALRQSPLTLTPLSSGPFRVAEHAPGQRLVLAANPRFSGPTAAQAQLAEVEIRVIPSYEDRLAALAAGQVDVVAGVNVHDADALIAANPNLRVQVRPGVDLDYLGWNLSNPLFSDVRVRTALAQAVNLDQIKKDLFLDASGMCHAQRAVGTIPPSLCAAYNHNIELVQFKPDQARALLAEAGWGDADKDGILDKDGVPFHFKVVTTEGIERRRLMAKRLQTAWLRVGVEVEIIQMPPNQVYRLVGKGRYDAVLVGWADGLYVDPSALWQCPEGDDRGFNVVGYCNPDVDALIDRGLSEPDAARSGPIWAEVQAKIYEDQPYLFLYWLDELVLVSDRVDGVEVDERGALSHLERWHLSASR